LDADSDGDVILHSLCNAFSSAIGEGSLDTWAGEMFQKGVTDSKQFLLVILEKINKHDYKISNISIAIEAKEPKLEGKREEIQEKLVSLVGIEKDRVGLTFTSGEGLTSFGNGKGIQAISMVLLEK